MSGDLALCPSAGAARSRKPDAAKPDIAKLAERRDKLRRDKDLDWEEIVTIQRQVAAASVLHAQASMMKR